MVDQRGQKIGFVEAIKSFFKGYVDFLGYTSRSGYWFVVLVDAVLFLIIAGAIVSQLASVGLLSMIGPESDVTSVLEILASGFLTNTVHLVFLGVVLLTLLMLPLTTLYVRRLRDAGLTDQFIAIMFVLSTVSFGLLDEVGEILSLVTLVANIVFLASKSNALKTSSENKVMQFLFQKLS